MLYEVITPSGKNPIKIVAAPMPLPSQSVISRSKNTQGRFVATCSNAYEWSDMAEDGTS